MSSIFAKLTRRPVEHSAAHVAEKAPTTATKVESNADKVAAKASKPVETDDLEQPSALESKEAVNSATKDKAGIEAARRKAQEKAKAEGTEPAGDAGATNPAAAKKSSHLATYASIGMITAPFIGMAAESKKSGSGDNSKSPQSSSGSSTPAPSNNNNNNGQ